MLNAGGWREREQPCPQVIFVPTLARTRLSALRSAAAPNLLLPETQLTARLFMPLRLSTCYSSPMKVCRFKNGDGPPRIGLISGDAFVCDLTPAGLTHLEALLEADDPTAHLDQCARKKLPRLPLAEVQLLAPVERQEVWAAGVTYLRSKTARMEESDFSANAYDRVYAAERPELFFKSMPEKVVAPGEPVGIRRDAKWNVPEPELALVMNSRGRIVGYTTGNDMSSRDIEGENLLYLPQAKIYSRSCALGPWITLGASESEAREWSIRLQIRRSGQLVFAGETSVGQIKRSFEELSGYLYRCQVFPHGAVLLTGTGIVPPEDFTLQEKDEIVIEISGIGSLRNVVTVV
jgi:2-dehydro-3-deoxy-D-arabinonate dehydratase